jgi:hypothetical protein
MDRYDEINTPNFREDPALYDDDILVYLRVLGQCEPTALSSAQKPSLSDYDLHDDCDDEEVREAFRWRRLQ